MSSFVSSTLYYFTIMEYYLNFFDQSIKKIDDFEEAATTTGQCLQNVYCVITASGKI